MHKPGTTDRSFTHNRGCIKPGTVQRALERRLWTRCGYGTFLPAMSSNKAVQDRHAVRMFGLIIPRVSLMCLAPLSTRGRV
jgi:hypothetical protein